MNDAKTFTVCGSEYINSLKKVMLGLYHLHGRQNKKQQQQQNNKQNSKINYSISGSGAVFPFSVRAP